MIRVVVKKHQYQFVFVILVYRNTHDVVELLANILQRDGAKVIMVNSYYDDKTEEEFQRIADKFSCDFLSVPNKGYGYGNNQGIMFALAHYDFRFLIVANPDLLIENLHIPENVQDEVVLCPVIRTAKGKSQNPLWVMKNEFSEWLMYQGYVRRSTLMLYAGIAINKIIRELFLRWFLYSKKDMARVYAPHGSFLIFPKTVLKRLGEPFDDKMFLFSEEMYLARRLSNMDIPTIMTKSIEIIHKQDGSVGMAKVDEFSESLKSYIYYYTHRERVDRQGR